MNIFKKFKWFYKYFGGVHVMGGRTYDRSIKYVIDDKNEREAFLKTFYVECPPLTFLDERNNQKYYLLRNNWLIVSELITLNKLFHFRTIFSFPKYIWVTIKHIYHAKDQYDWYMNPDPNKPRP